MANGWLIEQDIDLAQPVSRQYTYPHGLAMSGDDRAQRLRYTVYDGQNAADLSGTVKAYYRRPDNTVIESTSGGDYVTVSGNVVTAEMPPEAYEQTGNVECLVKLYATDGKIITLARCDINVTHGVEQDETIIPAREASRASLEDRVAAIEAATGVVPIDQLPNLPSNIDYRDYFVVDDGNGPYKVDWVTLYNAVRQYLSANNLTTTSAGKLLDARQGKVLNDSKQDLLTFDSTPTDGSTNPATSGGIKTALDGKQNTLTFDTTPTTGSTNPVTSGGIADAIAQSTATVMGVDIPLVSNSVAINPGTVQLFTSTGISSYKFVDLYFEIQGGSTNAVRLWPGYVEKKYKFGFFAWNDDDNARRRIVVTFTSAGRYIDQISVKYSYNDDAFADKSNLLYLVKAVGYVW